MVIAEPMTASVVRVTKPDTILIRTVVPHIQAQVNVYGVLMGTSHHTPGCQQAICDWVEIHADGGRLLLETCDWLRDGYGRLLIDLLDMQSRESLCDWLVEQCYCEHDGNHVVDCVREMLTSKEPEDA